MADGISRMGRWWARMGGCKVIGPKGRWSIDGTRRRNEESRGGREEPTNLPIRLLQLEMGKLKKECANTGEDNGRGENSGSIMWKQIQVRRRKKNNKSAKSNKKRKIQHGMKKKKACPTSARRTARSIPRVERSVVRVEPPAPLPQRKQIVEVRREIIKVPAAVKHTVHRIEEKKRTEEVERRVVRRERRHKSRRLHRSHHSSSAAAAGGHQQEYHYGSWAGGGGGGGGGYRSSSASRRSGYTNGFGGGHHGAEHHLMPIAYEGSRSAASDRYFGGGAGRQMNGGGGQHARYGSVSDSLRRGDLKYGPNGELLVNGSGNVKHHRVHKAHSTRDVFYHGDGGRGGDGADSHYSSFQRRGGGAEPPFVEFPPTLDRRSDWSSGQPEPPPHHRRQFADEYAGSGGVHQLTKARSFADWEEGGGRGRAQFGSRHDEDMARLEHEFRDARLMRIPSGNMQEKEHHHREIPGGYETYSRETKAHSDRKVDGVPVAATGQPTGTEVNVPVGTVGGVTPLYRSREASQDFGSRRDGQK